MRRLSPQICNPFKTRSGVLKLRTPLRYFLFFLKFDMGEFLMKLLLYFIEFSVGLCSISVQIHRGDAFIRQIFFKSWYSNFWWFWLTLKVFYFTIKPIWSSVWWWKMNEYMLSNIYILSEMLKNRKNCNWKFFKLTCESFCLVNLFQLWTTNIIK